MKEIVDRILQEEQTARSRIASVQSQAGSIIEKAKLEANALLKEEIEKAERLSAQKKEECESQFLADKERILKEAREKSAMAREKRQKDIPAIAQRIFSDIIVHVQNSA